jgi:endonuclease/exonuclease/phosphatase family metal-dependent hydrolase
MRIRILSYNIHKAIGVDRRFAPERIAEIIHHHNPDIALLQEVDRHVPRSGMVDLASQLARDLRYDYRAVGMNVHMKRGKYGNATLSRFPIGRQRNIDLTVGGAKRRGAQHTRMHIEQAGRQYQIDIFNVHLGLTARLRRAQVERLLSTADVTQLSPGAACVIAGDTNDWQGELKRKFFVGAGFRCATNGRAGSRWAIKTFPSVAPNVGLDKIFYRGTLDLVHAQRSRLKLARLASDHLPVLVEFDLQPTLRYGACSGS